MEVVLLIFGWSTCGWFKPGKHKFFHKLFQGNPVLQSDGDAIAKAIQHTSHGSSFFGHIDKDLAQRAICIFPGPEENNLSVDFAFWVNPRLFAGNVLRSTIVASSLFSLVSGEA